jgi:hypothetical protein
LLLLRLGCQVAQGFGIARPMPGEELPKWLASWAPDPQWAKVAALDPADRPLLYGAAEHIAWVSAIEAFLAGKRRVSPSLDVSQCRLGVWISAESSATRIPALRELRIVHQELHALGADILALNAAGHISEARNRLDHLCEVRDRLNRDLKALLKCK